MITDDGDEVVEDIIIYNMGEEMISRDVTHFNIHTSVRVDRERDIHWLLENDRCNSWRGAGGDWAERIQSMLIAA